MLRRLYLPRLLLIRITVDAAVNGALCYVLCLDNCRFNRLHTVDYEVSVVMKFIFVTSLLLTFVLSGIKFTDYIWATQQQKWGKP